MSVREHTHWEEESQNLGRCNSNKSFFIAQFMNLEIHGKDNLMFFFPYIAAQIEEAKATIAQLEEELRTEELLVINKKEYNRFAKNISLHKSRRELTQ